jgi:uncharacterized protein (TIGR04255 family)
MNRVPTRLARSPLLEAVFEIRYETAPDRTSELLPGLLFHALGERFSKLEPTPLGVVPKVMRAQHPELRYAAQFKLQGKGEAVLFGDSVLSLSVTAPYPGWSTFLDLCLQVAAALQATGNVGKVERYSLKYVNIIETPGPTAAAVTNPLEAFKLRLDTAGRQIKPGGFKLRFETIVEPYVNVVECTDSAEALMNPTDLRKGMLFVLDTIHEGDVGNFWAALRGELCRAHDVLETLFLELLEPGTIESMGPSYE